MNDRLHAYRSKRDFRSTPEPAGGDAAASAEALSFVIQKHAARNLHYDFRLELDGSLKSWAVPKGPSLDPALKRMAVHVEDHPLSYASFEGVIPPNQYGAGTVIVWDRGTWVPIGDPHQGYAQGKLKFVLHGEKLHGGWTLVRMHGRAGERQEPWLLIKERDDAARPLQDFDVVEALPDSVLGNGATLAEPAAKTARKPAKKAGKPSRPLKLPLNMAPQLATLVDRAPAQGDWRYEIKFDGYRILARIDGDDVRLFTRNGHDWTSRMRPLADELRSQRWPPCWLDGEVIVLDARGLPDFQALQNAFDAPGTEALQFFVFDLPFVEGDDLRERPLTERRERLRRLMQACSAPHVRYSDDFDAHGADVLATACRLGMEGVIGKHADSLYRAGRSAQWIKLKCAQRQEFVIGGYTEPKGSRAALGALMLGVHDEHGALRYVGNVGTGFDEKTLKMLQAQLEPLRSERAPFEPLPKGVHGNWVRPKLVAEVAFAAWTSDGRLRQAVFHGLRSDKPAESITREKAVAPPKEDTAVMATTSANPPAPTSKRRASAGAESVAGIRITHGERVIDASSGLTKLALARYYERVADAMLPHLRERPVSLVRAPDGIGGELFFQKHASGRGIPNIKQLDPSFDTDHDPLMEVDSLAALIGAVQMNTIEFHTWNATTRYIEQPDRMTFDLDPGDGVVWQQVVEGAELTRALLDALGLASYLKTSGGKGLHIVVPLLPRDDWETVKDFSKAVVQHLAETIPERFVAKSGPTNRIGKIFVDYLRNARGATTVAAFSARSRPGLGVSVPLRWEDLPRLTASDAWNIESLPLPPEHPGPWQGYADERQDLQKAMRELGFTPPG